MRTEQATFEKEEKGKRRLDASLMADSVKKVLLGSGHLNSSFSYDDPYKIVSSTPSSDALTFPSSSSKGISSGQRTRSTASFASANLFSSGQSLKLESEQSNPVLPPNVVTMDDPITAGLFQLIWEAKKKGCILCEFAKETDPKKKHDNFTGCEYAKNRCYCCMSDRSVCPAVSQCSLKGSLTDKTGNLCYICGMPSSCHFNYTGGKFVASKGGKVSLCKSVCREVVMPIIWYLRRVVKANRQILEYFDLPQKITDIEYNKWLHKVSFAPPLVNSLAVYAFINDYDLH